MRRWLWPPSRVSASRPSSRSKLVPQAMRSLLPYQNGVQARPAAKVQKIARSIISVRSDATGATADLSSVLGGFDPSALSTDLSTLLASLGTGVGSESLTQLLTDFSTQFAADFGPQVATDLATSIPGMF